MNCNLQFEFKNQTSNKGIISDLRNRISYMYINFQQNQVSRSLKTVHTNIFANNRKLNKIATTNSNIEKNDYLRNASSYNVRVYQFSANSG